MDNFPEKTSKASRNEVETYAALLHSGQATGYLISVPYHVKRRNWWWVLFGAILFAIHAWSAFEHAEDIEK